MNLAFSGRAEAVPNTEGGQTAHGRWDPPTNFGHLIGDLLGMRTLTPSHVASPHSPRQVSPSSGGVEGIGSRVALESLLSRPPKGRRAPVGGQESF